jgi:hypothetical protein
MTSRQRETYVPRVSITAPLVPTSKQTLRPCPPRWDDAKLDLIEQRVPPNCQNNDDGTADLLQQEAGPVIAPRTRRADVQDLS